MADAGDRVICGAAKLVLKGFPCIGSIDVRNVSEPFRQRCIDLAMHEPPLLDIEADQMSLTNAGRVARDRLLG